MKTNCAAFVEEIAAFVSEAAELSREAQAHVRECARCRAKIAELKGVAALHQKAAGNLLEPSCHLGRTQLERALAGGGERPRDFELRWRPVLAATLALAFIVGGVLVRRVSRDTADASRQAKHEQRAPKTREEPLEPTLLTFRHEVEAGRDPMLVGTTGTGIRHYRVKDAESELWY